jgi:hypothetical protein
VAEGGALTPEQLAEQIKALKVPELVISTVATLGQLAYVKLEAGELDEARLAIDAVGALTPLLEGRADPEMVRQLNQLLADVRLSFASATTAQGQSPGQASNEQGQGQSPGQASNEQAEGQSLGQDENDGG